jgi:hypothetical protein
VFKHTLQVQILIFSMPPHCFKVNCKTPNLIETFPNLLSHFSGKNNVIGYQGTIRNCDHNVIILPYFPHDRFQVQYETILPIIVPAKVSSMS